MTVVTKSWAIGRKEREWEVRKKNESLVPRRFKRSTEHPIDWVEDGTNHS